MQTLEPRWARCRMGRTNLPTENLVRSRGLEPPRLAALAPQASASASSATTALKRKVLQTTVVFCTSLLQFCCNFQLARSVGQIAFIGDVVLAENRFRFVAGYLAGHVAGYASTNQVAHG